MGDPTKWIIRSCNPEQIQREEEIEKLLGIDFPYCAKISPTEGGGIRAESTYSCGEEIREIDRSGNVYFSNKCSEECKGLYWDGFPWGLKCLSAKRVRQSNAVDPSKLAEARDLLLKAEKTEAPAAVVQKN